MKTSQSDIHIRVFLDENKVPEKITWTVQDQQQQDQPVKAMLLALFDEKNRETLKIDLWTKDMQVMEMDRFFYQTLRAMTETYFKATNNQQLARAMQQFVRFFGEETEILPRENKDG